MAAAPPTAAIAMGRIEAADDDAFVLGAITSVGRFRMSRIKNNLQ